MFANAVSSAVERLYAAPPADGRAAVARVSAVTAVAPVRPVEPGRDEALAKEGEVRDERDRLQQRQALTRGVLSVFESAKLADDGTGATTDPDADAKDRPAAEARLPDPKLEEAILRFIHTMFRSLAEADPSARPIADARVDAARPAGAGPDRPAAPADTREALAARIANLAQRVARAGTADDALAATEATSGATGRNEAPAASSPDARLQQAYAEVVQALRANLGGTGQASQTTRAELVAMMQRLANAMQGAPPIDPGLPTRGGLLSARA